MSIARLVEFSRRHAVVVVLVAVALAVAAGWYDAHHAAIDSDTSKLVDPTLPWQKASAEIDAQFPQNDSLLLAVVDAKTPDQSSDAAAALSHALAAKTDLFRYVRQPDANTYFRQYGLLFLSKAEVQDFADHIIAAQPFLGTLAADPSLRGVMGSVDLLAQGALRGDVAPAQIDGPLGILADAAEATAAGKHQPISWQGFFTGRKAETGDLRHFVLASTARDFGKIEAASRSIEAVRTAAREAGLVPANGVTVRVTGQVALDNDQLAALSESAVISTVLCLGLLCFWLVVGLRSIKTVVAIFVTLLVGLLGCATFAVRFIGPFNPVSIAFAPLFIGIAIDFGIQFSVRYSAERITDLAPEAFRRTALGIGAPLAVAAIATAVGFLSFAPTAYLGVRDLGLIAGAGMMIALLLNLTLLPALLSLFGAGAQKESAGFKWGVAGDRFLTRRRTGLIVTTAILAVVFGLAVIRLKFDFNPVDLENPNTESVRTLFDLMADPNTSPYTIEYLAKPEVATAKAKELSALPEVGRILKISTFVPEDQAPKLEILGDAAALLGPTLSPAVVKPAPTTDQAAAAILDCASDMENLGKRGDATAARLATALKAVLRQGPASVTLLAANFSDGLSARLDALRLILQAGPVTVDTLPADFRKDWVTSDGRWRVQVFPKGDARENAVLRRFARVVQGVVPDAVGSAVTVEEWTKLAPRAFATAGLLALVAISILLFFVLRSLRDVILVLVPLLIAGLFTLGAAAILGFSINFANIITLPMMLGIGVAFDIYFVMRLRAGEPGLLGSPTARAIVFSALTTGSAFGSLALSHSPGMAEMGKFLSLALFFILICTLFVLPILAGKHPAAESSR